MRWRLACQFCGMGAEHRRVERTQRGPLRIGTHHGLWGLVGVSPTGGAVELAPTEDPGCTSFSPKIHNHTLRTQNYICKWRNLRHSIIEINSVYHKFRSIAPTGSYRYQRSRGDMGCGSYQGRYGQLTSSRTLGLQARH